MKKSKKKTRKSYYREEKISILRSHLIDREPISDLCEEHGFHPTMFYRWQKELFDSGLLSSPLKQNSRESKLEQQIVKLEEKLQKKNEVVSELLEEHLQLKKNNE